MSEDILKAIHSKLDTMTKLLALNAVKGRPFGEQIELLDNAGMSPSEIASILGKKPNNVRVQLHYMRKKGKKSEEIVDGGQE